MKKKLVGLMLIGGGALFAQTRIAVGIRIGGPAFVVPAPVAVRAYRPPYPGPGYLWIEGYRDGYGDWYEGYWALPPYVGAYWIAPRFTGGRYFEGYWNGPRGIHRPAPRIAARGRGGAYEPAVRGRERAPAVRGGERGPAVRGHGHEPAPKRGKGARR